MRVLADACRDPGLRSLFTSLGGTKDAVGTGGGDVYKKLAAQVTSVVLLCLFWCSVPVDRTFRGIYAALYITSYSLRQVVILTSSLSSFSAPSMPFCQGW